MTSIETDVLLENSTSSKPDSYEKSDDKSDGNSDSIFELEGNDKSHKMNIIQLQPIFSTNSSNAMNGTTDPLFPARARTEDQSINEQFEARIEEYMRYSIESMIYNFKKDLEHIIEQTDPIKPITSNFVISLNSEIRKTIKASLVPQGGFVFSENIELDLSFKPIVEIENISLQPLINSLKRSKKSISRTFENQKKELMSLMKKRNDLLKFIIQKNKEIRTKHHINVRRERNVLKRKYVCNCKENLISQWKWYIEKNQNELSIAYAKNDTSSYDDGIQNAQEIERAINILSERIVVSMKDLVNSCIDIHSTRSFMSTSLEALTGDLMNYIINKKPFDILKPSQMNFLAQSTIPHFVL
ncbi:hypothetical protein TRFO_06407 [Tritrichomonas foetus]|uniref:Uncharacterized protein n=1 Tax=Tritrichomonas foetus TaxID=1144522 RepID=A0A1J4JYR1_9EUKA|nr:hypothetical protein TRFO_06407 [Tritrichomonas foetus]|eukprot:OHT04107.1 hypothetical protein TRFO_06407 [Tritrichomonas foetus]